MDLGIIELRENELVITEELNQELTDIASDKGISVTQLINQYIREGLKNTKPL